MLNILLSSLVNVLKFNLTQPIVYLELDTHSAGLLVLFPCSCRVALYSPKTLDFFLRHVAIHIDKHVDKQLWYAGHFDEIKSLETVRTA